MLKTEAAGPFPRRVLNEGEARYCFALSARALCEVTAGDQPIVLASAPHRRYFSRTGVKEKQLYHRAKQLFMLTIFTAKVSAVYHSGYLWAHRNPPLKFPAKRESTNNKQMPIEV